MNPDPRLNLSFLWVQDLADGPFAQALMRFYFEDKDLEFGAPQKTPGRE